MTSGRWEKSSPNKLKSHNFAIFCFFGGTRKIVYAKYTGFFRTRRENHNLIKILTFWGRGPRGILCTRGEKAHTSKRVSVIACDNVISKVQCATHRRERTPYERMHCILHIMRIPFREILTSLRSSE